MTVHFEQKAQLCVLGCRTRHGEAFPAQHGYLTCDPCADALRGDLDELSRLYPQLLDAVAPGRSAPGGPSAPGYGPKSPARDSVLTLIDRRTRADDENDPQSVLETLSSWADNVRDDIGLGYADKAARLHGQMLVGWLDFASSQPWAQTLRTSLDTVRDEVTVRLGLAERSVAAETAFLLKWWDFITRQYWVTDLADEVRGLLSAVRAATNNGERTVPVGQCPETVEGQQCGTRLRARAEAEWIACPRCRTRWPRARWDELSQAQGTPVSDVAALAAWLTVPTGTLRRWRSEDGWTNHGSRRRPLYDRAAVLASWERRRGGLLAG